MRVAALFLLLLCAMPGAAPAQRAGYPVTAGEHPGFTRVVTHTPPGTSWDFSGADGTYRLALGTQTARFDISRVFARIRRERLAAVHAEGAEMTLSLACDCAPRAWEERPGLIVIDIADPPPQPPEDPAPRIQPPSAATLAEAARLAGHALARAHALLDPPEAPPPQGPAAEELARGLGQTVAQALSQGLLDPSGDIAATGTGLLPNTPLPSEALLENIRVSTVLDRPDPQEPAPGRLAGDCPATEVLAFMFAAATPDFATAFAETARAFYGEFDQPDPEARLTLIRLYLMSGFGAEARVLIENSPDPVAGRDVLLGIADVLEDRASNSRHRLSQALNCGGAAAAFALLAGAEGPPLPAADIALTFSQFPATLRAIVGPGLVQRLTDAGAVDAARIAAESLRRSPWHTVSQIPLIDAELDRARGHETLAAERLAHFASTDATSIQALLDLALQTGRAIAPADLASAEALASAERNNDTGVALMGSLVQLHARDGTFDAAFATLDRLDRWLAATPSNQAQLAALRNTVWHQLSHQGDDLAVAAALLNRQDWLGDGLAEPVRFALADRLLGLGLAPPVTALLQDNATPEGLRLRARAALAQGSPETALALLATHDDSAADAIRAVALAQLGENGQAARAFRALGEGAAARHAAILAGDWQHLQQNDAPSPDANEAILGNLLTAQPGHSQMTRDGVFAPQAPVAPPAAPGLSERPQIGPDSPPAPRSQQPAPDAAAESSPDRRPALAETPSAADEGRAPDATPNLAAGASLSGEGAHRTMSDHAVPPDGISVRRPEDTPTPFDRLGVVTRGSLLLSESEHLRDSLQALVETPLQ
ncbi:MAG: hypothetical protein H6898_04795 [Rhodobacter sp.]|nr:hypothetical protein [Paracoccaceae bacterium]MCC0075888.1 hypothetical protein [Rhodobacter sp.]